MCAGFSPIVIKACVREGLGRGRRESLCRTQEQASADGCTAVCGGAFQIQCREWGSTLQKHAGEGEIQGAGYTRPDSVGTKGEQRGDQALGEPLLSLQEEF